MFLIIERFVVVAMYILEVLEVDWLKVVIKNLNNFLLEEAYKTKNKALDLLKDLTYNIIIFSS